jgi:hypothetical protein
MHTNFLNTFPNKKAMESFEKEKTSKIIEEK